DAGTPRTDSGTPRADSGGPMMPPDAGGGAPRWSTIYSSIIATNCAPCHTTESDGSLSLRNATVAYTNLVRQATAGGSCRGGGRMRVVPGTATMSVFYQKVNDDMPACGERMPERAPRMSAAQIGQIRDWINAGAMNN